MNIAVHKFIEYIEANPAIWDKTIKAYQCIHAKETSWNNIAADIFPNWPDMMPDERQEHVKEIKSKWRNIRDYYMKFKNYNDLNNTNKRRKCNYAKYLTFLDNVIPQQSQICKEEEQEVEEEDVNINIERQEVQKFEEVLLDSPDIDEDEPGSPLQVVSPSPQKQSRVSMQRSPLKRRVTTGFQRKQTVRSKKQKEDVADADKSYLLSILPDYKMLSYEQKLDFRMYSLGFFKRMSQKRLQIASNVKHQ